MARSFAFKNKSPLVEEQEIVIERESGYALIPTSETKELYPSLPYEIDANGLEVVQWNIVYDNQYNYALAHLLTLVKTKYKPATLYPQNP